MQMEFSEIKIKFMAMLMVLKVLIIMYKESGIPLDFDLLYSFHQILNSMIL